MGLMSELLPDSPEKNSPFGIPPKKDRPEEFPIVTPGGPFELPVRGKPTELPQKTVPFVPGSTRMVPRPPQKVPELLPYTPQRKRIKRRTPLRKAA